ncbi:MAG: D-alanyl-D-alanine carboxypeptidase family protein, partial [Clostridiales bacterium]|nr:D-alanyl-D-alanine carboxypeptidase family protein [Clostridiales bacterium]
MKTRYMKNTVSLLLALVMTVLSLQAGFVPSYALAGGDWEYILRDDGTAEISEYTGSATKPVIPCEIDGYAVSSISSAVFDGCASLESVRYSGSLSQWCGIEGINEAVPEGLIVNCSGAPSLKTKNTEQGVYISWSAEAGAEGYYVFRKEASGGYKCIKSVSGTEFTDAKAKSGTEYTYAVKAYAEFSESGHEARSSYNSSDIMRLANPAIKLTNTASRIKISWNKVSGAKEYHLFKKTGSGSYSEIKSLTANSYEDQNVKAGTGYAYAVYAYNGTYKSACSPLSIVRLTVPDIKISNANDGMKINWKKISGAKTYDVYRKTSDGTYEKTASCSSLSYTDKKVKSGTNYRYAVYALNGNSKSSCAPASLLRLASPKVKLTNIDCGVSIKWGTINGSKGYYVFRKDSSGGYKKIGSTTNLTYTDKTVKNKTTYYYAVRAYNGSLMSSYTNNRITFKIYENQRPARKGSFYYGVSYRSPTAKTCDVFKHGRNLMLVNKEWELPENFKWDLVYWSNGKSVDAMSLNSKKYDSVDAVDRAAYAPLKRMFADARKAGVPLMMVSAYRSINLQDRLFTRSVNSYLRQGYSKSTAVKKANYSRTFTGTSEHNIGLGFDIT